MLAQLLPQGTPEKHMGCLLKLKSIPQLCMLFTDHSNALCVCILCISESWIITLNMWQLLNGVLPNRLSRCLLQSVFIGIHQHCLELRVCFEKVITETLRDPLVINLGACNGTEKPEMLSLFPSAEDNALYISVIIPWDRHFICTRVSCLGFLRR